jgi:hypothetical protein
VSAKSAKATKAKSTVTAEQLVEMALV